MYQEFMTALDEAGKNDACVVAMVTGAGDYYCSGNDLSNILHGFLLRAHRKWLVMPEKF